MISFYMPTHRTGAEIQQDPIRLKNLLREAEEHLSAWGVGTRDVQAVIEPASRLLQDSYFWQHPCRRKANELPWSATTTWLT